MRCRPGSDIISVLAVLLLLPQGAHAVVRRRAPQKAAHPVPHAAARSLAHPATHTQPVDVSRAGELASEYTDRQQSERMDPTAAQTELRVHAWMQQHGATAPASHAATKPVAHPPARTAPRSTARAETHVEASTESDLPAKTEDPGHKATADDFDAAAAAQSKAHEPQPTPGKPRSAVEMPDDATTPATSTDAPDEAAASQAEQRVHAWVQTTQVGTPARTTRAEATAVAESPTPRLKLAKPQDAADPTPSATQQARNARRARGNMSAETAVRLSDREFPTVASKHPRAIGEDTNDVDVATTDITRPPVPALRMRHGHLIVPPPMKGSHEILVHQNIMADRDGLDRIQDDDDLLRMRRLKLLAALPVSNALRVNEDLPADRRYARPWTVRFLNDLARAHYARFRAPVQVNSAVRTVDFQRRLMLVNGNAAPPEGETASPHLTGQAIDLAKRGMSVTEIAWMRGYLLPLVQQGRIDVEEEFQQSCFHVSVYRSYLPQAAAPRHRHTPAGRRSSTRLLATAMP